MRTPTPHFKLSALLGLFALLACSRAMAVCAVSGTGTVSLGSKTSFEVRSAISNAGSGASGLACPGIIGLLTNQFIFTRMVSKDAAFTNVHGDTIPFTVATQAAGSGGTTLVLNVQTANLAISSLLSIGGASSDVSLFYSLGAAANVTAGTYTAAVTLRWHAASCGTISAIGICIGAWTVTPGITQNCALGLCTLNQGTLPGTGTLSVVTATLAVTRDCQFTTNNIDFGTAPFVSGFSPIVGNVLIACTKGETYTVGLSNGNNPASGRRQMASGAQRLQYDVFKSGTTLWNSTSSRYTQATAAVGNAAEIFPYEARIYTDQTTPSVGSYSDTLILDVAF